MEGAVSRYFHVAALLRLGFGSNPRFLAQIFFFDAKRVFLRKVAQGCLNYSSWMIWSGFAKLLLRRCALSRQDVRQDFRSRLVAPVLFSSRFYPREIRLENGNQLCDLIHRKPLRRKGVASFEGVLRTPIHGN